MSDVNARCDAALRTGTTRCHGDALKMISGANVSSFSQVNRTRLCRFTKVRQMHRSCGVVAMTTNTCVHFNECCIHTLSPRSRTLLPLPLCCPLSKTRPNSECPNKNNGVDVAYQKLEVYFLTSAKKIKLHTTTEIFTANPPPPPPPKKKKHRPPVIQCKSPIFRCICSSASQVFFPSV